MFRGVTSGFKKFFTKERVFVIVLFLILIWGLVTYSGSKTKVFDGLQDGTVAAPAKGHVSGAGASPAAPTTITGSSPSGYSSQSVANPSDLLPQDQNSQWAALNPTSMNKGDVLMPDLLQAGYHIGLDTIGQTLRNPNLQLRSDPIISKSDIGPWNQSTIEPDYGRVPLELGEGPVK
jgi:hypothetical protein